MRVLFLGSNYNPISIACADTLAAASAFHITIGIEDPAASGLLATARRSIRQFGVGFTLRRAADLARARTRLALWRLGAAPGAYRSLEEVARARGVPVLKRVRLREAETLTRIGEIAPQIIAVAAFGQIIRDPLLTRIPMGIVNVHPSLLPRYRGANPLYWVLARGERETGVTVHYVDEGIDTGDIILQETIAIRPGDTEATLQRRSASLGAEMLVRAVTLIGDGRAPRQAQAPDAATYFPKPPRGASRL